ncbi:MAG TPA: CD1871A family CXXC motif-containing protein [Clostridia bacterium]|nr:CD1871A family CXXC motif-containing protein [Clostridia bacterium]
MKKMAPYFKYALLLIGIAFVAVGVFRREYLDVLRKAALLCLECIGIG